MALPAEPLEALLTLDKAGRDTYFENYARYNDHSPPGRGCAYAIRVGSRTLWSDDTYELKIQFIRALAAIKRKEKRKVKSKHGNKSRPVAV